jgi:hypothetical protein
MKTILYQGKPSEGGTWMTLPDHCVATYVSLGYATRELVLRDDAEKEMRAVQLRRADRDRAIANAVYTACRHAADESFSVNLDKLLAEVKS